MEDIKDCSSQVLEGDKSYISDTFVVFHTLITILFIFIIILEWVF